MRVMTARMMVVAAAASAVLAALLAPLACLSEDVTAKPREKGQEVHSVFADPLFKDPAHGDWSFRDGSPALALGIAPIHPEEAGLYLNENRKTLPVEAEGAREHPEWLEN